ncbi:MULTISPECIES: hypothetical protein [Nonomuraea]|uniref:Uncharacterized protein n=1 Tax=Nonomuraea ferruginea TaxID=46174 RepID=A0ABT4SVF0_9ACTN|nr:hypothetical protein [Nonomuraea ferruginea]MDA0641247.1 hypothetical protein [Nonomuraea ferruginea]
MLEIPSLAILRYRTPEELISNFTQLWGVEPTAVSLPATEFDGPLFGVDGLRGIKFSTYASVSNVLNGFEDVVQEFASRGMGIVLTICPNLSFIPGEGLSVRDILGDASPQLCVANPRSVEVIAAILGTGVDIVREVCAQQPGKLQGIAIDATDLWPMGGSLGRVEATCFCAFCTQHFDRVAPDLLLRFKTFPNPWSLLLKPSNTGIGFVDEVGPLTSPEEIVGLSRQRGYVEQFQNAAESYLLENANLLLRYMRARHEQTVGAIAAIFDQACHELDDLPRRILIIEGERYGWTTGIWAEELDLAYPAGDRTFDEVWLNANPNFILTRVPYRVYMWRRSRYVISSFFDLAASATDPTRRAISQIALRPPGQIRKILYQRFYQMLAYGLNSEGALLSLPGGLRRGGASGEGDSTRLGFVGVSLDREFGERFINQLNIAPGQVDILGDQEAEAHQSQAGALSNIDPHIMQLLLHQFQAREG